MTQPVKQTRHAVDRSGFSNPLTLEIQVDDAAFVKVYADDDLLSLGSDYTIDGLGSSDGIEITIVNGEDTEFFPDTDTFAALFLPVYEQGADLSAGGTFGRAFEDAIDALSRQILSLDDRLRRSLTLPATYADEDQLAFPLPVAGRVLVGNAAADGFENGATLPEIETIVALTAEIVALTAIAAEIQTLADMEAVLNTLYGIRVQITSLGAVSASVASLDAIKSSIIAVEAFETEIVAAADNMAAILAAPDAATTATTKAGEAAASAADALAYATSIDAKGVPVGAFMEFAVDAGVIPGFLRCYETPTSFDETVYPELYAHLGTNMLPAIGNRVKRSFGTDTGAIGSQQADAFQGFWLGESGTLDELRAYGNYASTSPVGRSIGPRSTYGTGLPPVVPISNGTDGTPRTATETRVKAFIVATYIKANDAYIAASTLDMANLAAGLAAAVRTDGQVLDATQKAAAVLTLGMVFSKEYVSAEQTITGGGLLTMAHGLGVAPKLVQAVLVCKVAELGHSIGDEVIYGLGSHNSATLSSAQTAVKSNATNIIARMAAGAFEIANGSTGGESAITASSWRLKFRAWA